MRQAGRQAGRPQDQGEPCPPRGRAALHLCNNSDTNDVSGADSSERLTLGTEGTQGHWVPVGPVREISFPGLAVVSRQRSPSAYSSSPVIGICLRFIYTSEFSSEGRWESV